MHYYIDEKFKLYAISINRFILRTSVKFEIVWKVLVMSLENFGRFYQ